jgi:hypothetical protein
MPNKGPISKILRTKLTCLRLCLRAGNDVVLMPRTKGQTPTSITDFRWNDVGSEFRLEVKTYDGRWIGILATDTLRNPAKHGYAWTFSTR